MQIKTHFCDELFSYLAHFCDELFVCLAHFCDEQIKRTSEMPVPLIDILYVADLLHLCAEGVVHLAVTLNEQLTIHNALNSLSTHLCVVDSGRVFFGECDS